MKGRLQDIETARTVVSLPPGGERSSSSPPAVNGYEILGELGRGGMGVVYKATQTKLGRTVALKMILAADAEGEQRDRFIHEAEAVARFQHPNIVQIYEVGEADGRPFFSLEYVEGGTLEDQLEKKPLAWRAAAELVAVLARAIQAAHERGIVHRDLKPANILLAKDGTPKVTDFGIAKRLDAVKKTQTGKILGTPCYMAPEQALGHIDDVGPRSDIYALGAILYDSLTGRPPFEADNTMDTIMLALTREPTPPRTLQPLMPRDLEIVCLKCLEKKAEKRYQNALELALDLERLLGGEPIHARPISNFERLERWARRHPAWAMLFAVSALALIGLMAGGAWFTRQLQQELRATEAARKDATSARNELRLRLIRSTAQSINSDLRQLAGVPQVVAAALQARTDWSGAQLEHWLRAELDTEPQIFGMAVAFEPKQFEPDVEDYCLYAFRTKSGIEVKQLLPPTYVPLYREWEWYLAAAAEGTWSEPYVDEGGGEIPMVTFSMPFRRRGTKAGVVTADLSLEYFRSLQSMMRKSAFGGSSFAFVATPKGTIVSHPEERFRFPGPQAKHPWLKDGEDSALWARVLGGRIGSERGTDFSSGKSAELLFAPVKIAGWSCVAVLPD